MENPCVGCQVNQAKKEHECPCAVKIRDNHQKCTCCDACKADCEQELETELNGAEN